MCDGQAASNCDIISLAEYESMVNEQLKKIENQFKSISVTVNDILKAKKNALIKMCRNDPRIQHDDTVTSLQTIIGDLDSVSLKNLPEKEVVEIANQSTTDGSIDVGDEFCRPNVLMISLRCH